MYLAKKLYVKNWEHMKPSEKHTVSVKHGRSLRKDINAKRISYVQEEVMYWRKANQIHNWFVKHVQGGNDDCKDYYVTREQLQELVDTCKKVLDASKLVPGTVRNGYTFDADGKKKYFEEQGKVIEDPTVAKELLPNIEGFFFGGQDYDEWYYNDIKDTYETLSEELKRDEAVIADKKKGLWPGEYYYSASW